MKQRGKGRVKKRKKNAVVIIVRINGSIWSVPCYLVIRVTD